MLYGSEVERIVQFWRRLWSRPWWEKPQPRILKKGLASKVVFFYPGEEGSFIEDVYVRLYENGIVELCSVGELASTHIQNCEILWSRPVNFKLKDDEKRRHIRLIRAPLEHN